MSLVTERPAISTGPSGADATLELDLSTWAELYAGEVTAGEVEAAGAPTIRIDRIAPARFVEAFDQAPLGSAFAT